MVFEKVNVHMCQLYTDKAKAVSLILRLKIKVNIVIEDRSDEVTLILWPK